MTSSDWVPIRRAQVHRTHGQVVGQRAVVDHAALRPLPATSFEVNPGDLRRVGKDALVSFAGCLYSVPARLVRPGQRVMVRADAATVTISAMTEAGGKVLAAHGLATQKDSWVIDPAHWDGLPDGHTRATTTTGTGDITPLTRPGKPVDLGSLSAMLTAHAPDVQVAVRSLASYEAAMN